MFSAVTLDSSTLDSACEVQFVEILGKLNHQPMGHLKWFLMFDLLGDSLEAYQFLVLFKASIHRLTRSSLLRQSSDNPMRQKEIR